MHAFWLDQVEIYCFVVQRKALAPNDFHAVSEIESHLLDFQRHHEQITTPLEWKITEII